MAGVDIATIHTVGDMAGAEMLPSVHPRQRASRDDHHIGRQRADVIRLDIGAELDIYPQAEDLALEPVGDVADSDPPWRTLGDVDAAAQRTRCLGEDDPV